MRHRGPVAYADMIIYLGREQAKVNPRPYLAPLTEFLTILTAAVFAGHRGLVLTALGYDIEAFITDGGTTVNIVELIQNSSGFITRTASMVSAPRALYALNSGSFGAEV